MRLRTASFGLYVCVALVGLAAATASAQIFLGPTPVAIADDSISGTTVEDRFFGVTNPAGISAIKISNTSGGIEVDYLQYGGIVAAAFIQEPLAACIAPPSVMAAWWPGDGNANDVVDGNSGSYSGAFAAGKVGQAFSFDGAHEVVITHTSVLDFGHTDSFTLDAWIKKSAPIVDTSGEMVLSLTYNCAPEEITLVLTPAGVAAFGIRDNLGNAVDVVASGSLVDGQWHHLAGVRNAALGMVKLYLDGAIVASATDSTTGTFTRAGAQDRIGSRPLCPTPMFFNGLIDEVEVYRRALADSEVQALFNTGSAGKCKCNFDVDDNGQLDALTDGLMILRAGLGLTGTALTQDAIGPNANRSDPTAVLGFINANKLTGYDLDGNGTFDAVTDGLMILRYLFGLDGAAVVAEAVGGSATRPDWNAVSAFLASGCNSCQDGIMDLSESDVDCGGPTCGACAVGMKCLTNSDCQIGHFCNSASVCQ